MAIPEKTVTAALAAYENLPPESGRYARMEAALMSVLKPILDRNREARAARERMDEEEVR
jgi:hypothetical protein